MTGCSRFLIFFLIFAPMVYFGVSYFKGENPIEPIRNAIPDSWGKSSDGGSVSEDAIIKGQIKTLKDVIDEQKVKINRLEEIIDARDKEISRLKN